MVIKKHKAVLRTVSSRYKVNIKFEREIHGFKQLSVSTH